MVVPNQNISVITLCSLIKKDKLNGSNFLDWHNNLSITLKYEGKLHHIDSPLPDPPYVNATPKQVAAYQAFLAEQDKIKRYIDKLERPRLPMPYVLAVNIMLVIMEYLVKISKKTRILELKRRNIKKLLEEEKARNHGKVYNWKTTTYGRIWDDNDVYNLRSVETEFPAIVFDDTFTSREALSCEATVSPLDDNEIDFRISFDE
ncbi:hypothetical protein Tco_0871411 [Tanacetum coccineum]